MTPSNFFYLFTVALLLTLTSSAVTRPSLYDFSAFYTQKARQSSLTPNSTNILLSLLPTLTYSSTTPSIRMLLTIDEQRDMYKLLGLVISESELADLKANPDICHSLSVFMEFAFDAAADLLKHGAGIEKGCMRAFQQVLHMRAMLTAVLLKMGKKRGADMEEEVCLDKALIAVYGWLKGALIGLAREQGTWRPEMEGMTVEMEESLIAKKNIVITTKMNQRLEVDDVLPTPGIDFPEFEGVDGCLVDSKKIENDDGGGDDSDEKDNVDDEMKSGDGGGDDGDDGDEKDNVDDEMKSGDGGGDDGDDGDEKDNVDDEMKNGDDGKDGGDDKMNNVDDEMKNGDDEKDDDDTSDEK